MSKDVETKPDVKAENAAKPLESDMILKQIEALQTGKTPPVENASKSHIEAKQTESETTPDKAPKPTVEQQPALNGKAEETKAQDDKKSGKPEVDIREWAKRKSIDPNDTDSVLKAYREMERKLSQVNAKKPMENVPHGTEPPAYQPTPNWVPPPPPPPYYPPPQPTQGYQPQYIDRRAIIEQEAARFNVTPEDLERMLPIINEVTDLKLNRTQAMLQAKYDAQLAELSRGNKRNSEFNELMSDPLFTTPEVAFEIDQILSENPMRLKLEPTPWTNMFKDALERLARKDLQKRMAGPTDETESNLPSAPPKVGGRGTSPTIPVSNAPGAILEKFKTLDVAEMEKQLAQIGAIPPRG